MIVNKEEIEQGIITAAVTLIVAAVGFAMFNLGVAVYSGITAGLSVTVGKEYGDSLIMENSWHWRDILPSVTGVVVGLVMCLTLYLITML